MNREMPTLREGKDQGGVDKLKVDTGKTTIKRAPEYAERSAFSKQVYAQMEKTQSLFKEWFEARGLDIKDYEKRTSSIDVKVRYAVPFFLDRFRKLQRGFEEASTSNIVDLERLSESLEAVKRQADVVYAYLYDRGEELAQAEGAGEQRKLQDEILQSIAEIRERTKDVLSPEQFGALVQALEAQVKQLHLIPEIRRDIQITGELNGAVERMVDLVDNFIKEQREQAQGKAQVAA